MSASVRPGEVLDGKYRVECVIGRGCMGVVVAATHLHLEQRVAIKFLLPEAMRNPDVVARFAGEARAAAKIQSEHVARVIDVSTLPTGAPYMVMEYLDGSDLSEVIGMRGALPIPEAVDYVLQACEALAEAHAAGIVHRDLKPANMFLARRADGGSIVKVLDFGISKLDRSGAAMTKTSAVMGSPLYMSPEQLRSTRNVDRRSDIWAIGVILHELLSGRVPFDAETMPELCTMILTSPPPPLRKVLPDAPPELEAVIQTCLQRDPNNRYHDVAALAAALSMFGSGRESAAKIRRILSEGARRRVEPSPSTIPVGNDSYRTGFGGTTGTAWAPSSGATNTVVPGPRQSKRKVLLGMSLAVAFALMAGSAATTWHRSNTQTPVMAMAASPAPPLPIAPAASSSTTPDLPEVRMIDVSIHAKPPDAKIFVDNVEIGPNPYTTRVKTDGSHHKVRVEAPGHETQEKVAVFDEPVSLNVDLLPQKVDLLPQKKEKEPSRPSPKAAIANRAGKGRNLYNEAY